MNEESKISDITEKIKEKERKQKINTGIRRAVIGLLLMSPMLILVFTTFGREYLFKTPNTNMKSIALVFIANLFIFGNIIMSFARKSFLDKEFEDRKLKEVNYKFKFKDQFYRYVKPNTVRRFLIMEAIAVSIFVIKYIDTKRQLFITGFIIYFIFNTIWVIYCNALEGGDEFIKYVINIFIALVITLLFCFV